WPNNRFSRQTCGSASGWSLWASSEPTAEWSSIRRPTRPCTLAITSWCWDGQTACASSKPRRSSGEPMSARVLDGQAVAAAIRESVLPDVQRFTAQAGRPPGLGIVLVGEDPASEGYVRNKVRAGTEAGLRVDLERLAATATLDELVGLVHRLNESDYHDGILVQSPLPAAMGKGASQQVFDTIDPAKDVDGFHPINVGRLVQGRAHLVPCTPSGVIEMLVRNDIRIGGARAVVIGRSEIVG